MKPTRNSTRKWAKELDLLSRLSNALAVTGDEQEVRAIVYEELKEFEASMRTDAMGNVLVTQGSGKTASESCWRVTWTKSA